MEDWKQAFWLTKFELKYYLKSLLLLVAILIMLLIFIVPTMADYFEDSFLSVDIFFIIAFCFVTHWIRPKPFKIEDINSGLDRKSTRLNSSHVAISYAVFCLKK